MTDRTPPNIPQIAGEGWQPIESAPKDGQHFIGLWRGQVYTISWVQYYVKWPHEEGGPTFRGGWSAETWDQHMPCQPTHWMPLPYPPTATAIRSGETGA